MPRFHSFVIFAEMRTGSNLLEATLNAIRRVTCFGEAFNPYMLGWPGKDELQGITAEMREAEPRIHDGVYSVLGVDKSVKSRTSYGGTAPDMVREAIGRAKQRWLSNEPIQA